MMNLSPVTIHITDFVNGVRTKCMKQMVIFKGMADNLYPKIDADPISRLATDFSAGVHYLAR